MGRGDLCWLRAGLDGGELAMKHYTTWIDDYNTERHSPIRRLVFRNGSFIRAIQKDAILHASKVAMKVSYNTDVQSALQAEADKLL